MRAGLQTLARGRLGRRTFAAAAAVLAVATVALFVHAPEVVWLQPESWPLAWAWLLLLSARLKDAGRSLWRLTAPIAWTVIAAAIAAMGVASGLAGWEAAMITLLAAAVVVLAGAWGGFVYGLAVAPPTSEPTPPPDFDRFSFATITFAVCLLIGGAVVTMAFALSWAMALLIWIQFRLIGLRLRDMGVTRWIIAAPLALSAILVGLGSMYATDDIEVLAGFAMGAAVTWLAFFIWLSAAPTARGR